MLWKLCSPWTKLLLLELPLFILESRALEWLAHTWDHSGLRYKREVLGSCTPMPTGSSLYLVFWSWMKGKHISLFIMRCRNDKITLSQHFPQHLIHKEAQKPIYLFPCSTQLLLVFYILVIITLTCIPLPVCEDEQAGQAGKGSSGSALL